MEQLSTVAALIDLWSVTPMGRERGANIALAHDLNLKCARIRSMRFRSAIDVKHWPALIEAAQRYANTLEAAPAFRAVNADLLLRLHTKGSGTGQSQRAA